MLLRMQVLVPFLVEVLALDGARMPPVYSAWSSHESSYENS
jgi:hypothetical protein